MSTFNSRELLEEELDRDPMFRFEWERLALARQVAGLVLRYRVDHGLTQVALAERLSMTQSGVARLESGEVNPTIETLQRLSHHLGIPIALQIQPSRAAVTVAEPNNLVILAEARRRRPSAGPQPPARLTDPAPRRAGGGARRTELAAPASAARVVKHGPAAATGQLVKRAASTPPAQKPAARSAGSTARSQSNSTITNRTRPSPKR